MRVKARRKAFRSGSIPGDYCFYIGKDKGWDVQFLFYGGGGTRGNYAIIGNAVWDDVDFVLGQHQLIARAQASELGRKVIEGER